MSTVQSTVRIVSFGYGHDIAPPAHITLDLRLHFRDPHVTPALRYMTADDEIVRETVRTTPGIASLVAATTVAVTAFLEGPTSGDVTVAVGCQGGRHRAPSVALELQEAATRMGYHVTLTHRDLRKDVINR